MTDRRHIRGRIRAGLRRQAALALARLDPFYFALMAVRDEATWADFERALAFARREHAKLVRQLAQGLAIGPLTARKP